MSDITGKDSTINICFCRILLKAGVVSVIRFLMELQRATDKVQLPVEGIFFLYILSRMIRNKVKSL